MMIYKSWVVTTTTTAGIFFTMIITTILLSRHRLVLGLSSSFPISKSNLRLNTGKHDGLRIYMSSSSTMSSNKAKPKRGKLLVLGGTGFLGKTICKRANLEGYSVTSLSRRGLPSPSSSSSSSTSVDTDRNIDYRMGDARNKQSIQSILNEGGYVGVIHCIGLLFDDSSGVGNLNYYVSGSGSVPDENSTYDAITRQSAENAIDATIEYVQNLSSSSTTTANDNDGATTYNIPTTNFPFVFISAAEAGWPNMTGGKQVERFLAPKWLKRYLAAKRAVEERLLLHDDNDECNLLRPIIPRPSLIYSLDRPASYVPVGAFFVGNKIGLPFVDRPVTVQSLANAVVRSISRPNVRGIQRYKQIDELNQ